MDHWFLFTLSISFIIVQTSVISLPQLSLFQTEECICLVFYHCEAILNLSSSFSLFSVIFCCSAMSFLDAAARNAIGFTVCIFPVVRCSSLPFFIIFLLFYLFFLNIFIRPFHNSENSLFILSCAQERQFVWLSKHKHISLIYYSNKYWRILAFYLAWVTNKTAQTQQSVLPRRLQKSRTEEFLVSCFPRICPLLCNTVPESRTVKPGLGCQRK